MQTLPPVRALSLGSTVTVLREDGRFAITDQGAIVEDDDRALECYWRQRDATSIDLFEYSRGRGALAGQAQDGGLDLHRVDALDLRHGGQPA